MPLSCLVRPVHSLVLTSAMLLGMASSASAADLVVEINGGDTVRSFSQADLEALGTVELRTSTPWTDGVVVFTGVQGATLLRAVDAPEDGTVIAAALDNYIVEMPVSALKVEGAMIATRINGEPMEVATKGPFWIMYDFDNAPVEMGTELRNHAVWQLVSLEIE